MNGSVRGVHDDCVKELFIGLQTKQQSGREKLDNFQTVFIGLMSEVAIRWGQRGGYLRPSIFSDAVGPLWKSQLFHALFC